MKSNKEFIYTYTAPTEEERKEIESIKRQYTNENIEKDNLTRLCELDAAVKKAPVILGIALGVVGSLIFGTGLTMVLEWSMWVWGCVIAAVGVIPMGIAYPVYTFMLKRNKKRYGDEIVRLSEELLHDKQN